MNVIQKYFVRRFFLVFLIVFGFLEFLFSSAIIFRATSLGESAVPFGILFKSVALASPFFVPLVAPFSFICAVWLISRDIFMSGEFASLISFGINPRSVFRIFLFLSFLISSFTLLFTFHISPLSFLHAHLTSGFSKDFLYYNAGKFLGFDRFVIRFEKIDGNKLDSVIVSFDDGERVVSSRRAYIYGAYGTEGEIRMDFIDGVLFISDDLFGFEKLSVGFSPSLPYMGRVGTSQIFELLRQIQPFYSAHDRRKAIAEILIRVSLSLAPIIFVFASVFSAYIQGPLSLFPFVFFVTFWILSGVFNISVISGASVWIFPVFWAMSFLISYSISMIVLRRM